MGISVWFDVFNYKFQEIVKNCISSSFTMSSFVYVVFTIYSALHVEESYVILVLCLLLWMWKCLQRVPREQNTDIL